MREVLRDLIKQTSSLYDGIEFTCTPDETIVEGINPKTKALVKAKLKAPIPDFVGSFGFNDVNKLNGFLNFPAYNTESSKISVTTGKFKDEPMVQKIRFDDGRGGFAEVYTAMKGSMGKASIGTPSFGLTLSPDKNRLNEFRSLASIHGNAIAFTPVLENSNLYFSIDKTARVLIAENVNSMFSTTTNWVFSSFDKMIKTGHDTEYKISFSQGLLKMELETEYAVYEHYLRGNKT